MQMLPVPGSTHILDAGVSVHLVPSVPHTQKMLDHTERLFWQQLVFIKLRADIVPPMESVLGRLGVCGTNTYTVQFEHLSL